ncbi:MAG: hypothetical protein II689_00080 [Firmicutes bacterium]|nr:hypothetical protein [Bacillota bacterium]
MSTEKLYQKDVYLKEAELPLAGVSEIEGGVALTFAKTIFYPEGGGQPCDLGTLDGFEVFDVKEKDGEVIHKVKARLADFEGKTSVKAAIDWQRRYDHMQMHCGEHILSGAFYKLFGAENKGFHMGDDYLTIDMLFKGNVDSHEAGRLAEAEANRVVWADVPVTTVWFDTREEANSQPLRKAIKADEDISVVFIGDHEDPADCCACCGTHPKTSGEVGIVKIVRADNYKGMVRYTVKCGRIALEDYSKRLDLLAEVCRRFSSDIDQLPAKLDAQEAKNEETKRELVELKKGLAAADIAKILASLGEPSDKSIRIFSYDSRSAADLQNYVKELDGKLTGPIALVAEKENTALLVSGGEPDVGKLVKDYAQMYQGKGGGSRTLSRAIFQKPEDLALFLDLVEKHLR